MAKNPENYFMCLGKYAYDPFVSGDSFFVRVAHRGIPDCIAVVKVLINGVRYGFDIVSSTMPLECVHEFSGTLQRNIPFLMRWGSNA